MKNLLTDQLIHKGGGGASSAPPVIPPVVLNPPVYGGPLLFPTATRGELFVYPIAGLFTGTVTSYTLVTGTLNSNIEFDEATGIFAGYVDDGLDSTDLSVSATNDDGTSDTSNLDTITVIDVPQLEGTLLFPDAITGNSYSYNAGLIFTNADSWTLETGSLTGSGITFNGVTGFFESASVLSAADFAGLSISATNADGTSVTSNAATLSVIGGDLPITQSVGFTPDEGMEVMLDVIYNNDYTDRGTANLTFGLMTNTTGFSTPTERANATLLSITEPTGTGYSAATVADSDASIELQDSGHYAAVYPREVFTASAADWEIVTGWYIATTGITPKLLHVCVSGSLVTVGNGDEYGMEPLLILAQGVSGTTSNAALILMLNMIYAGSHANRGNNLDINLVDASGGEIDAVGGYTTLPLTDGTWTVSGADATYTPDPSWEASGAAFTPDVKGYNIESKGAVPETLHTDLAASAVTVADGDTYKIDLTVTT